MSVILNGALPKSKDKSKFNGLSAAQARLEAEHGGLVYAIVLLTPTEFIEQLDNDADPMKIKLGVVHAEIVAPSDERMIGKVMTDVFERRTGLVPLPFDA